MNDCEGHDRRCQGDKTSGPKINWPMLGRAGRNVKKKLANRAMSQIQTARLELNDIQSSA